MPQYQPFIEWLDCDCIEKRRGFVNLFALPFRKLASDGMPAKKYRWFCYFEIKGKNREEIFLRKTMKAPPQNGMRALVALAREMGCQKLTRASLKNGKIVIKSFLIQKKST